MIDINLIISNALTAAVTTAIAPLNERIAKLEQTLAAMHNVTDDDLVLLGQRIDVLESRPAQGVDMTLEQRVAALESETQGENRYLNRDDVAELIAEAMDDHTSTYDHDSYDAVVSDSDDYVKSDDLEDTVREAVSNLSFDISVS